MIKKTLLFICLLSTIYSCDRPKCENQNPVFDQYEMDSKEYKLELWNQINTIGQDNLRYWFGDYLEEANKDFMLVYIQNDDLCAEGKLLVRDWGKFKSLRTTKRGYRGAELKGLKFNLEETAENVEFVFQSMEWIID